jgi:hypothetical protein
MVEVQTPFIDEKELKSRCEAIASEFSSGKRALYKPMLSAKEIVQSGGKDVDEMASASQEDPNG